MFTSQLKGSATGLSGVLSLSHSLPVDPEGHQTGPGAGGDVHRLSGWHSRREVCAILWPVHALAQTHRRECCAEGAPAASWQDHRVHQPHRPGCRQGEGASVQDVTKRSSEINQGGCLINCTFRLQTSSHLSLSFHSVTSSCLTPPPSCSCSWKPRLTSMTWRMTILR